MTLGLIFGGTLVVAGLLSGDNIAVIVGAILYATSNLVGTIYAANRAKLAKNAAVESKDAAQSVRASVGEANGVDIKTLLEQNGALLQRMVDLDTYQHDRNHDIINLLLGVQARQHTIAEAVGARLFPLPNIDEHRSDTPKEGPT